MKQNNRQMNYLGCGAFEQSDISIHSGRHSLCHADRFSFTPYGRAGVFDEVKDVGESNMTKGIDAEQVE